MNRQERAEHFIYQDSRALRIALEFDDVIIVPFAAHQVGLRSAAHSADLFNYEERPLQGLGRRFACLQERRTIGIVL